jgi:hypothetical protein
MRSTCIRSKRALVPADEKNISRTGHAAPDAEDRMDRISLHPKRCSADWTLENQPTPSQPLPTDPSPFSRLSRSAMLLQEYKSRKQKRDDNCEQTKLEAEESYEQAEYNAFLNWGGT